MGTVVKCMRMRWDRKDLMRMGLFPLPCHSLNAMLKQKSRAVARKPRDAAAVLFGLKFADNIHYKFKSSYASKAKLQSSKHSGAKQNLMQKGLFKVTQWKDDNTKY